MTVITADALPQWDDYLQQLGNAKALQKLLPDQNDAALSQDLYRLLMLGLAQGYFSAFADANNPDFVPLVNSILNSSSTNPDFIYYQASIIGNAEHKISGYRGSALFVHIDIAAGGFGAAPGFSRGWTRSIQRISGESGRATFSGHI
mgnify:CR=1 FL=1